MKRCFLLLLAGLLLVAAGCGSKTADNPVVTLEMDNGEKIVIELYPDIAPNTVANFVHLVEEGFYDGLTFHRATPQFIQGGCPEGDGSGHPGWSIAGEFDANGFANSLKHQRGVVSMARRLDNYDSAGCQFFIMAADYPGLDGDYATFGRVVKGMLEVDIISRAATFTDLLLQQRQIVRATVELNNYQPQEPEKLDRE